VLTVVTDITTVVICPPCQAAVAVVVVEAAAVAVAIINTPKSPFFMILLSTPAFFKRGINIEVGWYSFSIEYNKLDTRLVRARRFSCHRVLILCLRLITKSWIVFVQAIVLSFESIVVEFLTEIHGISSLLVAGISIPLAGMTLLFISTVLSKKLQYLNHGRCCSWPRYALLRRCFCGMIQ
jgi:hypothetical protein